MKKHFIKKEILYFLTVAAVFTGLCLKTPTTVSASSKIEINKQTFPEEQLRKKVASFDKNGDGILSKAERKQIKNLSIYKFLDPDDVNTDTGNKVPEYKKSDFVFDFQGIQHLTSLKKLEINLSSGYTKKGKHYASVLSNFDKVYALKNLKSFKLYSAKQKNIELSKLPKLKTAILGVPNLSSVTIDNQYLEKFWLTDSTSKLKSINFQHAPKLTVLYLDNMRNTELIFGEANATLQEMHIYGNKKTTSLDITHLKNLKKLSLEKLGLSKIDFSENTNLEDVYIDHCSMKTLDFSKNEKLTWLACEGNKTKEIIIPEHNVIETFKWVNADLDTFENENLNPDTLTSIILFGNHIQSLDLTRYKNLTFVSIDKKVTVELAPELNPEEIISY